MRLSTRLHGIADYLIGAVLLALPFISGWGVGSPEGFILVFSGGILILNALATNFELGALRRLSIPVHLWVDAIIGMLLAVSPWVLNFDRTIWMTHVAIGVLLILLAFVTNTVPGFDRRRSTNPAG